MPQKIGVRELKNQTSNIVRQIREEAAEYVITYHGEPVAVLRPIDQETIDDIKRQEAIKHWEELQAIGKLISENWQSEKSPSEILEEMREEESRWPL